MNEKLFNPDYLLHLCQKSGLRPSKKYGQNYLINPEVIEHIIEAAVLTTQDTVVEVGPGFGVLTMALAEKAGSVVAFEIEKKLESYWQKEIQDKKLSNLKVVWGNVLKSFPDTASEQNQALGEANVSYKVVANLPYQITSPVIRTFLEAAKQPESMVLMVQKEVAERICAKPGDMSLLAISIQYYADPEYVFTVPRTDFWPSPAVDSAVIRVVARPDGLASSHDAAFRDFFFKIVKAGFAQKRKLLTKNLEPIVGKKNKETLKQIIANLGLEPTVRAQELSVEEWIEFAKALKQ